jgi:hypothetical protein
MVQQLPQHPERLGDGVGDGLFRRHAELLVKGRPVGVGQLKQLAFRQFHLLGDLRPRLPGGPEFRGTVEHRLLVGAERSHGSTPMRVHAGLVNFCIDYGPGRVKSQSPSVRNFGKNSVAEGAGNANRNWSQPQAITGR